VEWLSQMLYEDTLTQGKSEVAERHPVRVLLTWEALRLRDSFAEFILFLAASFGVVALAEHTFADHETDSIAGAVPVVGGLMFFTLILRLNLCVSRWWEGRVLWGRLIYAAINAVQQARTGIKDENLLRRFTHSVIVFSWACKAHLRGKRLEDPSQEGSALVARGLLEQAELDHMASLYDSSIWQPYYCLDVMRSVVNEGLRESGETNWQKELLIDDSISKLATSIGGMIRVKATGTPKGYDAGLKGLVVVYCFLSNFVYAAELGYYTPLVTTAIYFFLWILLTMGTVLLDPFGVDPVDHPMGLYCTVIERQCNAVRQRQAVALHLPPSKRATTNLPCYGQLECTRSSMQAPENEASISSVSGAGLERIETSMQASQLEASMSTTPPLTSTQI